MQEGWLGVGQPPQEHREVYAYSSVQDLIHAAIEKNDGRATLRQIYSFCEKEGRIAYRRSTGSRLITSNDHWKSQVRHTLYTTGRFERCKDETEFWVVAGSYQHATPLKQSVTIVVDANGDQFDADNVPPSRNTRRRQKGTSCGGISQHSGEGSGQDWEHTNEVAASHDLSALIPFTQQAAHLGIPALAELLESTDDKYKAGFYDCFRLMSSARLTAQAPAVLADLPRPLPAVDPGLQFGRDLMPCAQLAGHHHFHHGLGDRLDPFGASAAHGGHPRVVDPALKRERGGSDGGSSGDDECNSEVTAPREKYNLRSRCQANNDGGRGGEGVDGARQQGARGGGGVVSVSGDAVDTEMADNDTERGGAYDGPIKKRFKSQAKEAARVAASAEQWGATAGAGARGGVRGGAGVVAMDADGTGAGTDATAMTLASDLSTDCTAMSGARGAARHIAGLTMVSTNAGPPPPTRGARSPLRSTRRKLPSGAEGDAADGGAGGAEGPFGGRAAVPNGRSGQGTGKVTAPRSAFSRRPASGPAPLPPVLSLMGAPALPHALAGAQAFGLWSDASLALPRMREAFSASLPSTAGAASSAAAGSNTVSPIGPPPAACDSTNSGGHHQGYHRGGGDPAVMEGEVVAGPAGRGAAGIVTRRRVGRIPDECDATPPAPPTRASGKGGHQGDMTRR